MKIKVLCLLFIAPLFLNGCALLFDIGGNSGSIKNEITLSSLHSEGKKNAITLLCYASSYSEEFLAIYIKNETNERIFIEWENARCDGGKIVFSDDRRITMNNPKVDEAVSANSESLRREITSLNHIGSDYIVPLFRTKSLKEGIDDIVSLKIPIKFVDGKVEEYTFNVRLYWEATN